MPRRKRAVGEGSKSGIKKKEDLGWQVQKDKRRKGLRKGSKDGGKAAKNIGGGGWTARQKQGWYKRKKGKSEGRKEGSTCRSVAVLCLRAVVSIQWL